jgi:hypothetical protein
MGKQQNSNDDLFQDMDISGFESQLLEVDKPETIELEDELGGEPGDDEKDKGKPGGGAPGKGPKAGKGSPEPGRKPKDDTLIVDTGSDDITDDDDDKNKSTDKTTGKTKGGGAPVTEENESPVYLHAAALQEHGVLPNFDLKSLEGLDSADAIVKINEHIQEQMETQIAEGVEEYKSTLGEKARQLVDDLEKGIPFESLADNYTLEERYGSINAKSLEDNEELQEQIYADLLSIKGFSDTKIKKMVEMAKEKEILFEESKDGLKEIQGTIEQERKEMRINAEREKTAREESIRKTKEAVQTAVKSTKEIFPGIEITEDEKKDLSKMLTVPVMFKNKNGENVPMSYAMAQRAKNPLNFELRLAYFIKNGLFDDKISKESAFNIFTKKIETSATKRLGAILDKQEKRSSGRPAAEHDKEEDKKKGKDDFVFPQELMNIP